jgi:hypothetical protein
MTLFERQNASVNKFALTLKDFYTALQQRISDPCTPSAPMTVRRCLVKRSRSLNIVLHPRHS